ncbi:MAG: ImmA/IrrE family metallo-endopeptidase [Armatimonadetes bacterium]|nr:ImmA/IrrE family metallo-endopeptidase [Armatimonadota bacterium]
MSTSHVDRQTDGHQPLRVGGVLARLSKAGISTAFVRETVLPDWWNDEIAGNPAGLAQFLGIISRNLGVEMSSLREPESPIRFKDFGQPLFKTRKGVSRKDLHVAQFLVARCAQVACQGMESADVLELPSSPRDIRAEIINTGADWVTLEDLLDYCWSHGVAVVHVSRFPPKAKKMDAMVARSGDRYAIALTRHKKESAWLLFDLAHELGHVTLRHLQDYSMIVDDVDAKSRDSLEDQANRFAVELLTGRPDIQYTAPFRLTGSQLAASAREVGERDSVDPGVVALNYCWAKETWGVGQAALKILEPHADAPGLVNSKLAEHMNWDCVPEDSREFLRRMTGTDDST